MGGNRIEIQGKTKPFLFFLATFFWGRGIFISQYTEGVERRVERGDGVTTAYTHTHTVGHTPFRRYPL